MILGIILSFKYKVTLKNFKIAKDEIKRIKDGGIKNDIKKNNKEII